MIYSVSVKFRVSKELLMKLAKKRKKNTLDDYINELILRDIDALK